MPQFTKLLTDIVSSDINSVGQKAVLLAALHNQDHKAFKIPVGFVITADAYSYFMQYNSLEDKLQSLIASINVSNLSNLVEISSLCKKLVVSAKIPRDLEHAISSAYTTLFPNEQEVAVRNSVLGVATPNGLADTYLNIKGILPLNYAIKCCFASLFSERALQYLHKSDKMCNVGMAVIIQQMVRSDVGASGIAVQQDDSITIKSVLGLGEILSTNDAEPDTFVFTTKNGTNTLTQKSRGKKGQMSVYSENAAGTNSTLIKITPANVRDIYAITDEEATNITNFTGLQKGTAFEWAKDGTTNTFYIINLSKS